MIDETKIRKIVRSKLLESNSDGQQYVLTQPFIVRLFHWGFAASMFVLLLTGFELHKPLSFLALNFGKVFIVHLISAWLALAFVLLRLTDAILRRDASLLPKLADIKGFPKLLSYYLFIRSTPPPSQKYNSGQKLIFFSWFIIFTIATILGLASYWQGEHLAWVIKLTNGYQMLRWIKFAAAIYFSATIPVHVYLSITEDSSRLQAMVTGYERQNP